MKTNRLYEPCPECVPGQRCAICSQRVLRDGEGVRVPMIFRDGMQRALHDRLHGSSRPAIPEEVRAQARVDHALWEAQQGQGPAPVLDAHYREVLDAKGRQVAAQLREIADTSARIQAHTDHFSEQIVARDAAARSTPRDAAYADAVASMQRRGW